ncbi:MAG TPA: hypothetical protein O0X27_05590 [Methanocorpusculum sp.]|nr:hypothetical protein [Methanocorpusculum sp.]
MMDIIGTWKTEKTIPFLGSGDGIVAIHPDGHAKGRGRIRFLGKEHTFQADSIQIEQIGELQYRAAYMGKSLTFFTNRTATQLSMTVNPYRMGIVGFKHLDINIPLQFTRD